MALKKFKLSERDIDTLCTAGSHAPSGGNTQPWKINVINGCVFKISLDCERIGSFMDVGNYASIFALGCFIENILITARHLGIEYTLKVNEIESDFQNLAEIRFCSKNKKNRHLLYPIISKRVTNRKIYDGRKIETKNIEALKKVAESKKFNLSTVSNNENKERLAIELGRVDVIRTKKTESFNQMINEFRWSQKEVQETRDGLDLRTLELPRGIEIKLRILKLLPFIRYFVPEKEFRDNAKPILIGCSHLCCLHHEGKIDHKILLKSGRITQRIWLNANYFNITFQPWSILPYFLMRIKYFESKHLNKLEIETILNVEEKTKELFNISGNSEILFIFRLSYAPEVTARSLKRNWKEFTTFEG